MRKTFNVIKRIKESVLKDATLRNPSLTLESPTATIAINSTSPAPGESGRYIQDKVTYSGSDHIIHPGRYFRS